ncbi:hypothetical protein F511_02981 [Dorcoceras hygrometricum]|uniref:Uncharacterized protein n=1 Tax=Dorcoceras hygrometricum TaxID=472368 RepID=A0A2Z7ADN0_9LAMI|nr:hypothetical protein F511_02981 [Dorcoceras hygrometricum]
MQYVMQSYYNASGFTDLRSSIFLIVISTVFGCPPTKSSNFTWDDRSRELCGPWLPVTDLGPILGVMQYVMQSYYNASGFTDLRSSIFLIVISTVFGCPPTKSSPKISKFQNRPKRARYRIPARKLHGLPGTGPNKTLEEISRHDIAGASPERRPPAVAPPRKNLAAACAPHRAQRRAPIARPARIVTQPAPSKRRPAASLRQAMARSSERSGATLGGATSRVQCGRVARPARNIAQRFARNCRNFGRPCSSSTREGPALEGLTRSARTDSPRQDWPEQFPAKSGGGGGDGFWKGGMAAHT